MVRVKLGFGFLVSKVDVCVVDVPAEYRLAVKHLAARLARVIRLDDDVVLTVGRLRPTLATTCSRLDTIRSDNFISGTVAHRIKNITQYIKTDYCTDRQ